MTDQAETSYRDHEHMEELDGSTLTITNLGDGKLELSYSTWLALVDSLEIQPRSALEVRGMARFFERFALELEAMGRAR